LPIEKRITGSVPSAGVTEIAGLRERKKAATRAALHEAALRLTAEQGIERVTVEAIADAANVSRRTFSNYFSSKEEALFHGDTERLNRLVALVGEQPAGVAPWVALTRAAEDLSAADGPEPAWPARRRLRKDPALIAHQATVYAAAEAALAAQVAGRLSGPDAALRSRLLAATFLTAVRVGIQYWVEHPDEPLAGTLATTLALAAPAEEHPAVP
jgi:AcrR family transcriptional regulator